MSDDALFPGFEPPEPAASKNPDLSADRRRTLRQAELIKFGTHPLGGTLHPDADRNAHRDDGKTLPLRCGTCVHRVILGYHTASYPKCDLTTMAHSAASDCRAWWPACTRYEVRDA